MEASFTGRPELHRGPEEKGPLIQRLGRIEGQVRGLRQTVGDDRHCLDVVQRAAAIREAALLVVSGHPTASVDSAVQVRDGEAAEEMATVPRAALRR